MDALSLVLPPAFGFVIGFVTNALAIRMMFRPYEEVRFLGLRFQGMVPRRKADIARSISRTVVSELLREQSVANRIAGADVRRALEQLVLQLADRYLNREYGSLDRILGQTRSEVVERGLTHLLVEAGRSGQEWAGTPEGQRAIESLLESLLERSPGDFLQGEEALLAQIAVERAMQALDTPDLEGRIRQLLARLLVRLAGAEKPVRALVPEEAVEAILRAVRSAVPSLLRRFERVLLAPQNVAKIKGAVRAGIEAYLLEMKGSLIKNLARNAALLGRERIFREADEVVDANLYRLGELVHEQENRAHVEAAIEEALDAVLIRTPSELLGSLPPETLDVLYDRAAAWICRYLRRPEATAALTDLLRNELERLFQVPLREVAEVSGAGAGAPERWARSLARWAADGGLEPLARREGPVLARVVMTTPLGRPSRFLPAGLTREIAALALDQLMPVVSSKVPEILRIVDVQALIEREILAFSPRQVETLILGVARRELRAITWWGGLLGTVVGGAQTVMALLGR